jgi:hypothetical protein
MSSCRRLLSESCGQTCRLEVLSCCCGRKRQLVVVVRVVVRMVVVPWVY